MEVRNHWGISRPAGRVRGLNTGSKRRGSKAAKTAIMASKGWELRNHDYSGQAPEFSVSGPGGLNVWIFPKHAEIHAGCRWAGFLGITPLRRVHCKAFHRIASVLKAKSMIIMPNDSLAVDLLWSGASFEDALASLEREFGPPESSVNRIPRSLREAPSRTWFLEDVIDPT
jgi:hypothetical protein